MGFALNKPPPCGAHPLMPFTSQPLGAIGSVLQPILPSALFSLEIPSRYNPAISVESQRHIPVLKG